MPDTNRYRDNNINDDEMDSYLNPSTQSITEKDKLEKVYNAFLDGNQTGKDLANKLTDEGLISEVKVWRNSWGYMYDPSGKSVYISQHPMPEQAYNRYVIMLGTDLQGNPLWPQRDEMDQYRFLHEVSHAYQYYLVKKEVGIKGSQQIPSEGTEIGTDSTFGQLLDICHTIRKHFNGNKGLTTWGSQADYDTIQPKEEEIRTRAMEDANELVTMYLWNPFYFYKVMEYLAGDIPGYGVQSLSQDRLALITSYGKQKITDLVQDYVSEMKRNFIYAH